MSYRSLNFQDTEIIHPLEVQVGFVGLRGSSNAVIERKASADRRSAANKNLKGSV